MRTKYDKLTLSDTFKKVGCKPQGAKKLAEVANGIREELEDMMNDVQKQQLAEYRREMDALISRSDRSMSLFMGNIDRNMRKDRWSISSSIVIGCLTIAVAVALAIYFK